MARWRPRREPEPDPRVVEALRALGELGRDPVRREAGRRELLAAVGRARAAGGVPVGRAERRHRVVWAALPAAAIAALAGVVVAAGRSLPGSPLYGVERAVEALEVRTTVDAQVRGWLELQNAERRADEAMALSRAGADALAVDSARDARDELMVAARDLGDADPGLLQAVAASVIGDLDTVAGLLAGRGDHVAAAAVEQVRDQTGVVVSATGGHPSLPPAAVSPSPSQGGGTSSTTASGTDTSPDHTPRGNARGHGGSPPGQTVGSGTPPSNTIASPTPFPGKGHGQSPPTPRGH